jgi:hypothetical protein
MLKRVVFVCSRFTENPPIWYWETNPSFLRWFCHSWLSEQDWGKTHMKASKNSNNVFGDERLAHILTIVVSLGVKLTYVFFYVTTELHQWRYVVIFWFFILFYCWWPYFIVCGFCRTIRACECLLLLFMRLFWLFVFSYRTWVGTLVLVLCEHEWVLRYWSFVDMSEEWWLTWSISSGTLTHIKTIETCVESAFATVCVRFAIASHYLLFWWGRLSRVALQQVT